MAASPVCGTVLASRDCRTRPPLNSADATTAAIVPAATSSPSSTIPRPTPGSGPDQDLDRLAVGHRPVAVGHAVEADGAVEDAARLDRAGEDVGQQLLDVGAHRRGAAADLDVL